ncbi:MAG: cytochrome c [Phycisphaerales bacterium]|jgi:nitric oxide reductase subunit C|nr:cytochrome c [Phycisphaerales bacterium]
MGETPNVNSFWLSGFTVRGKIFLLIILVACFGIQASMVYKDSTKSVILSNQAIVGRKLWHENNCQVCHQLYGFGGFLGPDLTNVTSRIDLERIEQILKSGSVQMPAFNFRVEEIESIKAFLTEMNSSGQGQAFAPSDSGGMLNIISKEVKTCIHEGVTAGYNNFVTSGCFGCHFSPTQSAVGAADLLAVFGQRSHEQLLEVLKNGKPPRMPKPTLTDEQIDEIYVFLEWLHVNKDSIRSKANAQPILWSQVPWWEFER